MTDIYWYPDGITNIKKYKHIKLANFHLYLHSVWLILAVLAKIF